jgi:intracellular sulfur oxidation DsrE/DsrF family protein
LINRSSFLTVASGAAALALAGAGAPAAAAPAGGFVFDRAAFEAVLASPARHRQVFGTARLGGALVLHYMRNSLVAYRDGFAEGPGTLHVAAVFYGTSIAAVCPDALWKAFSLEKYLTRTGEAFEQGASDGNPYGDQVAALHASGATFFVCNNALNELAESLANAPEGSGSDPGTIYAQFAATLHKAPGVMLVPAGVAALNAAQEAHFTLLQATLK